MIEQTMRIEETAVGLRLTGYNPVYPGTSRTYPSYSADNLYLTNITGTPRIINIDDAGVSSEAQIRQIEGRAAKAMFLDEFDWRLNGGGSGGRDIYLKNGCALDVELAIRYKNKDDQWVTKSWYSYDGNSGSYLASGGQRLKTSNDVAYIYARSILGNEIWEGEHARKIGRTTYKMRQVTMTVDEDGDYVVSLTCNR